MSTYFKKGKGWRYDFTLNGTRYSKCWFKTKVEARQAEAQKREEILKPPAETAETPTDTVFLELLNHRLDYVQAYKCSSYYQEHMLFWR